MTVIEEKLKAYSCPFWGNYEISLITGLASSETSKIKQKIVKLGGYVPGHGQKVYRDAACKLLGIDVKQEIQILRLAGDSNGT